MNKSKLLASTLGLALIAGPVLAQQADTPMRRDMPMQNGAMPMPAPATTGPTSGPTAAPAVGNPMHEGHGRGMRAGEDGMHRRHGHMRAERAAARAENRMDVGGLVEQASAALRAGRTAQATDLLEQSETRLLTRSAPSDRAGEPMRGPVLDRISAARGAIQARDRAGAMREMEQARAMLRADPNSGSGTMGTTPTQGGGQGGNGGWGNGQTMRDSGSAGTSMSRADAIIRVQAGGSSGSGGLSGSTPGSPGAGNPGSTPSTGMGTMTQPPQGSASPGVPMGGRTGSAGVGAPPPGATTPQGGGSGAIRPGSTPSGGGTGSNPSR